jgi:hypothetical protein
MAMTTSDRPNIGETHPNLVGTENYAHYERRHQLADVSRTWRGQGIQPGEVAPIDRT